MNQSQIFGGFDEIGFEMETPSLSTLSEGTKGIIGDLVSLLTENVAGIEAKKGNSEQKPIAPRGTIEEFNKARTKQEAQAKQKEIAANKRIFYQALKEEIARVENSRDRMIYEEELADIGSHMPTEEKNALLHYQANYKDRSTYQMAELRRKLIEQKKNSDKEKKEVSIAQTQVKGKTAMQGIFEGASGSQGSGQANLSFQAAG